MAVAVLATAGCTSGRTEHAIGQKASSSTSVPPTSAVTTTSPPPPPATVPAIGPRSFAVSGVTLVWGNWLTIGLHPTTAPVTLQANTAASLEVCPAGLDGGLTDSSWPSFFKFTSCLAMPADTATLPPTDGDTHVAVAIRSTGSTPVALAVTVDYAAADTFVEVIPPRSASTSLRVTYTPRTTTTGATVSPAGLVTPAPGYSLVITQAGRTLSTAAPCDFPTEAQECVGNVTPGQPAQVQLAGTGSQVVLYLAWD